MRPADGIRITSKTLSLLHSARWSNERIAEFQKERLLSTLRYAVEQVPFYKALGLGAGDIQRAEDLERFPVIVKADLQDRPAAFLSLEYDRSALRRSLSSGTTGEPLETYFDPECWLLSKYALKARRVILDSRSPKQRIAIVTEHRAEPRARSALARLASRLVDVRYFGLADDALKNLKELAQFRPTIVYGFPSYLQYLGELAESSGTAIPHVPLIYTSSEVLTEQGRRNLTRYFGGRVVDIYGNTEFKEIAVECRQGRYHVNFESVYLESIAKSREHPPMLVVTSLLNRAMPLIRYETGDSCRLVDDSCACGRCGPQIASPQGRLADMLEFPNGERVSPYLITSAIEQRPNIKHFRIVHESPWRLRIETFSSPLLSRQQRDELGACIQAHLPADVDVRFLALPDRGEHRKRRAVSREF